MPASRPDESLKAPFPTTRWSRVVAAGGRAGPATREAPAELCSAYWYPLYAFVRRKGHPPDEAADLVQGTFLTFLDRDRAAKRGGGATPISIDRALAEGRYSAEPVNELTPERLFDRR